MSTLLAMLALVGADVLVDSDLGACTARVIAPGQAVITDGTCAFDGAQLLTPADHWQQDGDAFGAVLSAHTLASGRVIVRFSHYQ